MPFQKQGPDDYTGPSGKHFNGRQVRYYYANGGHFAQGGNVQYAKGSAPRQAAYAEGGSVLGRTRDFTKIGDTFAGRDLADDQKHPKARYTNEVDYDNKHKPHGPRPGPDNSKSSVRQHKPRGK